MDVFIADDSRVVRERLAAMLADLEGVRVVGEAGDVKGAITGILALRPHTVVLDFEMPGGTGLDVLGSISTLKPRPRVIMLTNSPHAAYREQCRRSGADYFFDKTLEFEKLPLVLRSLNPGVLHERPAIGDTTDDEQTRPGRRRNAGVSAGPPLPVPFVVDAALLGRRLCGASFAHVHGAERIRSLPGCAPLPLEARDLRLYAQLCVQTLRDGSLVVIEDISTDLRYSGKQLICPDGTMRFFAGVPIFDAGGRPGAILAILDPQPLSLLREQEDALRALGRQSSTCLQSTGNSSCIIASAASPTRDPLTGLQNRVGMNESVLHGVAHAVRNAEKLGFLHLDLDEFYRVTDLHGRPTGDAFLIEIGKRLLASVRGSDTVARLGEDQFGVLARGLHVVEDAMQVAQKLLRALSLPFDANGRRWSVSCSMGLSVFPEDAADAETLLRHAGSALSHVKDGGKGGFESSLPALT